MAILNNIAALGNSMLQRPLAGALGRMNTQNQTFYAQQPLLPQLAQEERLRQEQDGLINAGPNRKRGKLKQKAMESPLANMSKTLANNISGLPSNTMSTGLGGLYG